MSHKRNQRPTRVGELYGPQGLGLDLVKEEREDGAAKTLHLNVCVFSYPSRCLSLSHEHPLLLGSLLISPTLAVPESTDSPGSFLTSQKLFLFIKFQVFAPQCLWCFSLAFRTLSAAGWLLSFFFFQRNLHHHSSNRK